jgi:UDP-2,3-diacylglucosamine hydrolase
VTTLFISDLHLDPGAPAIARQFLAFLEGEARSAEALYVLGDLFEAWLGDDDPDPAARDIVAALRRLTDSGVPCFVMHGNRDFLIGRRFCAETGARLIEDGTIVERGGEHLLLMHGDVLCTDDRNYQRLRCIVRNPCSGSSAGSAWRAGAPWLRGCARAAACTSAPRRLKSWT